MRTASVLGFSLIVSPTAFAYLDPGTGSIVLQATLAGIFSTLFFAKSIWVFFKSSWHKLFHRFAKNSSYATTATTSNAHSATVAPPTAGTTAK